jgi:hypothetical protein
MYARFEFQYVSILPTRTMVVTTLHKLLILILMNTVSSPLFLLRGWLNIPDCIGIPRFNKVSKRKASANIKTE